MNNYFEKLKQKWQINSNWSLIIIFIVFAITGSSSVYVSSYIIDTLQELLSLSGWQRTVLKIFTVTPIYMVLLLFFGFIFGQWHFFWGFQQKMWRRIGGLFGIGK